MISEELVNQLGLTLSETEYQFLVSADLKDWLPEASIDWSVEHLAWLSVLAERNQHLIKSALIQQWPFLSPDVKPEWLTAENRIIPSVSERQILLKCLLLALDGGHYEMASALAFVLDRFMYWYGGARVILNVVTLIECRSQTTPIAPQLIIRKARVMKDTGDLHGAMRILNMVYSTPYHPYGAETSAQGWQYKSEAQYDNVCAVCVQIKAQILHNLGLWQDAIVLLMDSVDGFERLPSIDYKGISTSYGLLSRCLVQVQLSSYPSLQQKYVNSFTDEHPCYQGYLYGHKAAKLCPPQSLFVARHYLTAAEALLMYAVQQQDVLVRQQLLAAVLSELKHSLSQHVSVQALHSREQCHELIKAFYLVSIVLMFSPNSEDGNLAWIVEELCIAMYTVYCRETGQGLGASQRSVKLIQLALSFLNIPQLQPTITVTETALTPAVQSQTPATTTAQSETGTHTQQMTIGQAAQTPGSMSGFEKLDNEKTNDEKTEDVDIDNLRSLLECVNCEDISSELNRSSSQQDRLEEEKEQARLRSIGLPASPTDPLYLSTGALLSSSHPSDSPDAAPFHKVDTSATTVCSTYTIEALKALENAPTTDKSRHSSSTDGTESGSESSSREESGYDTLDGERHCPPLVDLRATSAMSAEEYTRPGQIQSAVSQDFIKKLGQVNFVAQHNYQNNLDGTGSSRARLWRYDPFQEQWTAQSTLVYIGAALELAHGKEGKHRDSLHVHVLHQEEALGRYVAKRYRKVQQEPSRYLQDVQSQMSACRYVLAFNEKLQALSTEQTFTQIRYLPAAHLQLLDPHGQIQDFLNVEPYLEGDSEFVKLTNNYEYINTKFKGKMLDTALAFTHFTYWLSAGHSMIVDLQGWLPADHTDVFYLTDPQFHTTGPGKFSPFDLKERGMAMFWNKVHPDCNRLCDLLQLHRPQT